MECYVIIVNAFQPLTIISKRSILDVAPALDPPLSTPLSNIALLLMPHQDQSDQKGKDSNEPPSKETTSKEPG